MEKTKTPNNPLKGKAPAKKRARKKPARPKTVRKAAQPAQPPAQATNEAAPPSDPHLLTEDVALGALGLQELKLTPAEEAVLSRPVDPLEILIKPSGAAYLSHPTYTRWFNDAFGRLGWSLVPAAKPQRDANEVWQGYVLHIHGKPVAFAWGEQSINERNREQTFGDCLEATVASALRRCAKRLGVGLEMWDKRYLNAWIEENAIMVPVKQRDGKTKMQWRRKIDPPLPFEEARKDKKNMRHMEGDPPEDARRRGEERPYHFEEARPDAVKDDGEFEGYTERVTKPKPQPANPRDGEFITQAMAARLNTAITNSGRNPASVKQWLLTKYKADRLGAIRVGDYNTIVAAIEAPGSLRL